MNPTMTWVLVGGLFGLIGFSAIYVLLTTTGVGAFAVMFGATAGVIVSYTMFFVLNDISDRQQITQRMSDLRKIQKLGPVEPLTPTLTRNHGRLADTAQVARKMLFLGESKLTEIRLMLIRAGYYRDDSMMVYLTVKLVAPVLVMVAAAVVSSFRNLDISWILIYMMGAALTVSILIDTYLRQRSKARKERVWLDLPDALDLIIIYAETGVAFDTALTKVCEAMRRASPALATELDILHREIALLPERSQAYANLVERMDMQSIRDVVSILRQSDTVGSPISEGFRTMAVEMRRERMLLAERRAARIPVLITLPLMLFILPSLFIIIMGPAAMSILAMFSTLGAR